MLFEHSMLAEKMAESTGWIYLIMLAATTFVIARTLMLLVLHRQKNFVRLQQLHEKTASYAMVAIEACPIAGLAGTFAALTSALSTQGIDGKEEFITHMTSVFGLALPTTLAGMLTSLFCMVLVAYGHYRLESQKAV